MVYIATLIYLKEVVIIANIFVSTLDRKKVFKFPTLPEEFPTLSQSAKNEEFSSFNNGDFNLLNGVGLRSFSMGFMLPGQQYSFCKSHFMNTYEIINLLLESMKLKFPVRFVFQGKNNAEYINIVVSTEKFEYAFNHELNIVFNGEFKEYRVKNEVCTNSIDRWKMG